MRMSDKKFLFITHLTPEAKRSSTRAALMELMEHSLKSQSYNHWKAMWVGEAEREDGVIKTVDCSAPGSLSTLYLRDDVKALIAWADYIIKLDDDDIILPHTLEIASRLEFDCYADRFHTFHDLTTGRTTQQMRPWIAATCIHKKEHAITLNRGKGIADNFINSLFYGEHGRDWIAYYSGRKIRYAHPTTPVYVRVLSPTSISSGAKVFPVRSLNDVDMKAYEKYVAGFGSWNAYRIENVATYLPRLAAVWKALSGENPSQKHKTAKILQLKEWLKYAWFGRIWK
jgi:hypothetical protein